MPTEAALAKHTGVGTWHGARYTAPRAPTASIDLQSARQTGAAATNNGTLHQQLYVMAQLHHGASESKRGTVQQPTTKRNLRQVYVTTTSQHRETSLQRGESGTTPRSVRALG